MLFTSIDNHVVLFTLIISVTCAQLPSTVKETESNSEKEQLANPLSDFVLLKLFGSLKNKEIILAFLNEFLAQKIDEKILLVNKILDVSKSDGVKIDILVTTATQNKLIVEIQKPIHNVFSGQIQYHATKAYCSFIEKNANFSSTPNVWSISLCEFLAFKEHNDVISTYRLKNDNTNDAALKSTSYIFLEFPKFKKRNVTEVKSITEKWLMFFTNAPSMDFAQHLELCRDYPIMCEALSVLDMCSWNLVDRFAYYREEVKIISQKKFTDAESVKSGKQMEEMVRNMVYVEGLSKDEVKNVTCLSREKIDDILK